MRTRPWPMLGSLGIGTYLGDEDDTIDEQVSGFLNMFTPQWCAECRTGAHSQFHVAVLRH